MAISENGRQCGVFEALGKQKRRRALGCVNIWQVKPMDSNAGRISLSR